jgi:hypothetical protein
MAKALVSSVEELAASARRVFFGTLALLLGEARPEEAEDATAITAVTAEEWSIWVRLARSAPAILESYEGAAYAEVALALASSLPVDDPSVRAAFGAAADRADSAMMAQAWEFLARHLTAALDEPDDADSLEDLEQLWFERAAAVAAFRRWTVDPREN